MDSHRQQVDLVTGKTFTTSNSAGSYSQSQIIPYVQPRPAEYGSYNTYNNSSISQAKVSKSKSTSAWTLDDPEFKRRRRVASYKVYTVEGRVKASLRKSFRWFKNKYLEMRYGWWCADIGFVTCECEKTMRDLCVSLYRQKAIILAIYGCAT